MARSACDAWVEHEGAYAHRSGRFFRVLGVRIGTEERVMIDQPEVGVLAFLTTGSGDGASLLVQWKAEPGNVGLVQAAPTVQATRSNIDRVHGGRATPLLDAVLDPDGRTADALGSEQGDRFLAKENRDLVRRVDHAVPVGPGTELPMHEWIGRDAMAALLLSDHRCNTDARSVLASASWQPWVRDARRPFASLAALLDVEPAVASSSWASGPGPGRSAALAVLREGGRARPSAEVVPLGALRTLRIDDDGIRGPDGSRVLGWFDVVLPGREVDRWSQPLLEQEGVGRCVLVLAVRVGRLEVGVRPTLEPGWTRCELGPTLQSGHQDELLGRLDGEPALEVVVSVEQSDEGGRFFEARARYELARWHGHPDALGDDLVWLTLADIEALARQGRATTNELRSCLSLLLAHA